MSRIYEEFERQIQGWREEHAQNPSREMTHLFLLALEREQIVSTAYRESVIEARLRKMDVSGDVREILLYALNWAWKDEEMHAIYIRGAILKLGSFRLRWRAFLTQTAGAIGGWGSSVRHHAQWSEAPLSRMFATFLTWAGSASGRISPDVRPYLDYGPFREFCLFNVDAEKTAWLCWNRLTQLARQLNENEMVKDFLRIEQDEKRHESIFRIFAESLDEHDRLLPGVTVDSLADRIRCVADFFLPRRYRSEAAKQHPLGKGGPVYVVRGKAVEEKLNVFRDVLQMSRLDDRLQERARELGRNVRDLRIAVKTTFMLGYHRKDRSPITDPELLEELARFLKRCDCADVAVLEGPNIYDQFYKNRSVREVAAYFGIDSTEYRLVDVSEDQIPNEYFRGMGQDTVSRTWKDADFRISFGKMRSHPIELALLTVGNLEGIGSRCEEFIFVERQAHRETAVMTLVGDFPPHFALLDAYDCVPDGLLGVMGCPRPKSVMRFYAGCDALAVDVVAARHLGVTNPHESSLLRAAEHWFDRPENPEVIGVDDAVSPWRGPYHNEFSTFLSFLAYPVYVFGSGRGSLFVPEMDESAFPPVCDSGFWLRNGRRFIQAFLGLRHNPPLSPAFRMKGDS